MPIATFTGNRHYAVHTDHLNTPRRLTQSNKQVAWQWAFSAFGDEQPTLARNRFVDPVTTPNAGTTTIAEVTFNLRYPGQYFDKESGLSYNYFRSYDAKTGRYSQSDPVDLRGGWNKFIYADANPLSLTDPLGLWSIGSELYGGIGGGITFTCSDGKMEITSRLGTGLGGGFGFDPNQAISPHAVSNAGSIARAFGTVGAEVKVPTLSAGA